MSRNARALIAVAAAALPLLFAAPASATGGEGTIILPGNECLDYSSGSVQYNNGNPTMQPASLKVYNCS